MGVKKKNTVLEGSTSLSVFVLPLILLLICLFSYMNHPLTIWDLMGMGSILLLCFLPSYFMFFNRQIILTKNSLYIYSMGRKVFYANLIKELGAIEYRQEKVGAFLNFGTLVVSRKDGHYYQYYFLNSPKHFMDEVLVQYEKNMQKIFPGFKLSLPEEEEVDTIREGSLEPKSKTS